MSVTYLSSPRILFVIFTNLNGFVVHLVFHSAAGKINQAEIGVVVVISFDKTVTLIVTDISVFKIGIEFSLHNLFHKNTK